MNLAKQAVLFMEKVYNISQVKSNHFQWDTHWDKSITLDLKLRLGSNHFLPGVASFMVWNTQYIYKWISLQQPTDLAI